MSVPPRTVVTAENGDDWAIRISSHAHEKIAQEVARAGRRRNRRRHPWSTGRGDQCFYVIDVLPAPEDSTRSRNEFELGMKGLKRTISAYTKATNATLYCLGTWHSHLGLPSGRRPAITGRQPWEALPPACTVNFVNPLHRRVSQSLQIGPPEKELRHESD